MDAQTAYIALQTAITADNDTESQSAAGIDSANAALDGLQSAVTSAQSVLDSANSALSAGQAAIVSAKTNATQANAAAAANVLSALTDFIVALNAQLGSDAQLPLPVIPNAPAPAPTSPAAS